MTVWVVRHACAGYKAEWDGPDDLRPLDPAGARQARALVGLLEDCEVRRLVTSPARRCTDTLAPLSRATRVPLEQFPDLRPGAADDVLGLIDRVAEDGTVVCTHGEVMRPLLKALHDEGVELVGAPADDELLQKGAAWPIDRPGGRWRLELDVPLPLTACAHHVEDDEA